MSPLLLPDTSSEREHVDTPREPPIIERSLPSFQIAPSETKDSEANHETAVSGSFADSRLVHHDTDFYPYGDIMEHIDHSFSAAGKLSHKTDLLQLGSMFDGHDRRGHDPAVGAPPRVAAGAVDGQRLDLGLDLAGLVAHADSAAHSQNTEAMTPRPSLYTMLGRDTTDTLDHIPVAAHTDGPTHPHSANV